MIVPIVVGICVIAVNAVIDDKVQIKRLVLHSDDDVAAALQTMYAQIQRQDQKIADLEAALAKASLSGQGSTYTRWGRTVCEGNGTELVYKGFAGGSKYDVQGGAADFLCLTQEPLWGYYNDGKQSYSGTVHGAEYQFGQQGYSNGGSGFFGQNLYDHDVPCAVCRSNRPTNVMIPGRNQCYPGWNLEYAGYLVSGLENSNSLSSTNYACLDSRAEVEFGDSRDENDKLMYMVEAACGSLKCPPYVQNREITCAVCSK